MKQVASGPFDVTLVAQEPDNPRAQGAGLGRMSLDKRFHGDLQATSEGEMLALRGARADSAGYVAIERVTGTLHGRSGSFALQHSGTMDRGTSSLSVTVIPDSGSGELEGLTGSMAIDIGPGGAHAYRFEYTLGD